MEKFDFLICGGGIFGCYTALHLAKQGAKIALVEKEPGLFRKASLVNQARLHLGFHYPRSIATGQLTDEHKIRFQSEHAAFINASFRHFYALDKYNSFTDAAQFERFAKYLKISCKKIDAHPILNFQRLEAVFETNEPSFDPVLLSQFYSSKIVGEKSIRLLLNTKIRSAETGTNAWNLSLQNIGDGQNIAVNTKTVINATFSNTNSVLQIFGLENLSLVNELTEIALTDAPQLADIGLTVMDGPFCSIMPFGWSGLHSLSSVVYTPHEVANSNGFLFHCQTQNQACKSDDFADCNQCFVRPKSNFTKMESQLRQYLQPEVQVNYLRSMFTIKSKLKSNAIDDGRPTEIVRLRENPAFYCIFAGKVTSIYEVEKAF